MPSVKYLQVVEFLARNIQGIHPSGAAGADLVFPAFDLMAFDYLEFAEAELIKSSAGSRINCVAHLKRAVECEIDTLLAILQLTKHLPNFPKKLEFVGATGIVSPRSLGKLNAMRNRMEHQYANPDVEELELYFDLATSFVHTIEGYIFMVNGRHHMQWDDHAGWKNNDPRLRFVAELAQDRAAVRFELLDGGSPATKLIFEATPPSEYADALKIFFLMCRAPTLVSREYVISKLQGRPLSTSGRTRGQWESSP